jgi:imidazolonepropionase
MMRNGTGALEIKTGYGLDVENELKMLRVIQRLKQHIPIPIKATLLMGHALPNAFKGRIDAYMDHLENELLPSALEIGFDFIDIFCERDYFQVCHLEQILNIAQTYNKPAKIHVNQFYSIGGIQAAITGNALSIDHAEVLTEKDLADLEKNPIIVTGLPACSLFTKIPYTSARELMDRNIPVALATDFNPGSAPNGNMNLVNSLACIQMKMTPEEVVHASTQNGASAMQLDQELGSITIGKKANLILTEPLEHLSELFYYFGESRIKEVYVNGEKL